MTTSKSPKLPQSGGSYVRQPDGTLEKPADATSAENGSMPVKPKRAARVKKEA